MKFKQRTEEDFIDYSGEYITCLYATEVLVVILEPSETENK